MKSRGELLSDSSEEGACVLGAGLVLAGSSGQEEQRRWEGCSLVQGECGGERICTEARW